MKPSKLIAPVAISEWVRLDDEGKALESGYVGFAFGYVPGEFTVRQGPVFARVSLKSSSKAEELSGYLGSGRAQVASVDEIAPDGATALMTWRFYNGEVIEVGNIDVGLDDQVQNAARRHLGEWGPSLEGLFGALADLCTFTVPGADSDHYFLMSAGPAVERDFGRQDDDRSAVEVEAVERALCIQGDGFRLPVARKRVASHEEKFLAVRLIGSSGKDPDGSLRLARGRLTFSDFSRTGRIQALAAGTMAKLTGESGSYLRKWDEYGDLEGQMLLERARAVGVLRWNAVEPAPEGGVRFFFSEPVPSVLNHGDTLDIRTNVPEYLNRPGMTWAEYSESIEQELTRDFKTPGKAKTEETDDAGETEQDRTTAKVLEVGDCNILLDLQVPPESGGLMLVLSLRGDEAQIRRRMEARRRILEGHSANPMLGVIIEENGEPPEPLRRSTIAPLSGFVRRKVFSHAPTERQITAIDIALNTPDIALIQGPPGTGKTTVIAAIVERLNELADKGRSVQGRVLISAYQHDAIENMMARLTPNSLPVPKFGARAGATDSEDRNAENLRRWCDSLAARLRERNPRLRVTEQIRDLQVRSREYVIAPSLGNAIALLDVLLGLPDEQVEESIRARAATLRKTLESEHRGRDADAEGDLLREIWSLRTSEAGFLDDGQTIAQVLLERLRADVPPEILEPLEEAASWGEVGSPPFLSELRKVKRQLIDLYQPQMSFRIDKPRKDVLDFVRDAGRGLRTNGTAGKDGNDAILADFLHELESNPLAVQRAVEDYGFAYAATCQAASGKDIRRRKDRDAGSDGSGGDYDTVIIDEAARSAPRDLLIPMAQARRRIILVGDHRQLPHMVNEEIARSLEAGRSPAGGDTDLRESDFVRHSMFQYLLARLRQLEARDGICRWVTLDQQFRMHPMLGEFISDQFYALHDAAEAFQSPLPGSNFRHGLPNVPEVPAIWVDLPASAGEEGRRGTSRIRKVEATEIAAMLAAWIRSPEGRNLTFGVISFYSEQVKEVFAALEEHGLTTRDGEGWRVAREYRGQQAGDGEPGDERLRIGTVDSFQGMEFDVVFLSMVRTQRRPPSGFADGSAEEARRRRTFGHLTSANRLCVSMSRQKRLLVVVGDKSLVDSEVGRRAVPQLAAFAQLCEDHGHIREWGTGRG